MTVLAQIRELACYSQGEKYGELAARLDRILALIAQSPNPSGHSTAEDSSASATSRGEPSGPVGLGYHTNVRRST